MRNASVVYVVRNDRDALLKIGVTTDLPRRMRELSRLCKGRVTCLATFPGDDTLERHLHAHCAADSPFAPVLPPWVAIQPREGLGLCGCARLVAGTVYAAGACAVCHGAGVLSVHTEAA